MKRYLLFVGLLICFSCGSDDNEEVQPQPAEEIEENGFTVSTLVQDFQGNDGISVDSAGNLYVNSNGKRNMWNGRSIHKVTSDGEVSVFADNVPVWPVGSEIKDGFLYISGINAPGYITKIGLKDGSQIQFASSLSAPAGLEFDDAGNLYVVESGSNKITKFTPEGARSEFSKSSLFNGISEITYDSEKSCFYGVNWLDGLVMKIDMEGNATSLAQLNSGNAGTLILMGEFIYTTSPNKNKIFRINRNDGVVELVAGTAGRGHRDGDGLNATFDFPLGIAKSPEEDKIYISEISSSGNGSIRVITFD